MQEPIVLNDAFYDIPNEKEKRMPLVEWVEKYGQFENKYGKEENILLLQGIDSKHFTCTDDERTKSKEMAIRKKHGLSTYTTSADQLPRKN